jgi:hypothetical protein
MYKHTEKNDSRLAASVVPETDDSRDGLKFGPADPIRMKRAMACGSQAKLLPVSYVDTQNPALYPPLVDVEDVEAERCQRDLDQGYNCNADCDAHAAAGDRREYLSADDAVDRRVAFHEDDVEQGDNLGRIVSHEKAHHDLNKQSA